VHLKTLTIKGFKSFASSTTLRLEPGITAVVGPNGSGKSNVVDALTWVMGEQGAKNLRGGSMADVIFAGAGSRPALGRAEVSLTIDNTDGALPIDYTEVTISRTLFRGGGSEYQINGTPCRLLDVQELLSDTGLGRQMHVIVGQGRLDAAPSATFAPRAFNSAFQSEQEAMDFVSATPSEKLAPSAIRLSAASQFVMGSETNNFPVTISNPLPITVKVRVQFVSDSPNRIRVAPSDLVTLGPGEHRTVSISPSTTSNGVVTVRAQLTTEQGTAFGSVVPVEITATGLGRVGWIIIVISGAVVGGGTFLRIRAVQRERARESREQ